MVTILARNWLSKHLETTVKPRNSRNCTYRWGFSLHIADLMGVWRLFKTPKRLVRSMLMILSHFRLICPLYPFRCSTRYSHTEWQSSWPHWNCHIMTILNRSWLRPVHLFHFLYHQGFNDSRRTSDGVFFSVMDLKNYKKWQNSRHPQTHMTYHCAENRLTGELSSHGCRNNKFEGKFTDEDQHPKRLTVVCQAWDHDHPSDIESDISWTRKRWSKLFVPK